MAAAAAAPSAKRRRVEAQPEAQDPENPAPVPAGGDGSGGGIDRISGLHDAILGEIVSLLATKEAARTQVLSSRWRHVRRATPLVLDAADLAGEDAPADNAQALAAADEALAGAVSRVLAAHPGPGRRFRAPPRHLHDRPATVDAWLRSPALDNLQDLDFSEDWDLRHRHLRLLSGSRRPSRSLGSPNASSWIARLKGSSFPTSSSSLLNMSVPRRAQCKQ